MSTSTVLKPLPLVPCDAVTASAHALAMEQRCFLALSMAGGYGGHGWIVPDDQRPTLPETGDFTPIAWTTAAPRGWDRV